MKRTLVSFALSAVIAPPGAAQGLFEQAVSGELEEEGTASAVEITPPALELGGHVRGDLWAGKLLDEDQAERDALALQTFYRDEGFLDARVGYRLEFDTVDRSNLTVIFVFEEGDRYRIEDIRFSGNEVFSDTQVRGVMQLGPGSVLRQETLRQDLRRIYDLYGEIGYVDADIGPRPEFLEEPGVVLLNLDVLEGKRSRFGRITIRGNQRTRDEVVRRELRFYPGEDYDTVKARRAEQHLLDTGLFKSAEIRPLEDIDGFREALVEVEEAETITFLIGVGISTDSGVLGSLTVENRNFDLLDWPRTWGEFFRGQAFRGAGQYLAITAQLATSAACTR